MKSNIDVIDAIRRDCESANHRVNIASVSLKADGSYVATGSIALRSTMFVRQWLVSADLQSVVEA